MGGAAIGRPGGALINRVAGTGGDRPLHLLSSLTVSAVAILAL
jgi:hypothetical protein